jgi:thiamine-monophosphate kinase
MNEFELINKYFKALPSESPVLLGIGDDAACVEVPANDQLLISTDTLIADRHFHSDWDAYDVAWKSIMVNISDIAAMGGIPKWISLALTLPSIDTPWLDRFSEGIKAAFKKYKLTLIGGDLTKGFLSITITIHGLIPKNKAIKRAGARSGDGIWLTGELGAAALAVYFDSAGIDHPLEVRLQKFAEELNQLMDKLKHPIPRVDMASILQTYASACIDISDGLSGDLNHICEASQVGACLISENIPIHPLVKKYQKELAVSFALSGGDDYELCFTVPSEKEIDFIKALKQQQLQAYKIGTIEEKKGLRILDDKNNLIALQPKGYMHF